MSAIADGDDFVLNGKKIHVLDGNIAHQILVVARTDGAPGDRDGLSVFMLERDSEGLTFSNTRSVDNHLSVDIQFDAVRSCGLIPLTLSCSAGSHPGI